MTKKQLFHALTRYGAWSRSRKRKAYIGQEHGAPQSQEHVVIFKSGPASVIVQIKPPPERHGTLTQQADADAPLVLVDGGPEESRHLRGGTSTWYEIEEHLRESLYAHETGHLPSIWDWNLTELQDDPLVQYEESLAGLRRALAAPFERNRIVGRIDEPEDTDWLRVPVPDEDEGIVVQEQSRCLQETWWSVLTNDNAPTEDRVDALNELLLCDADKVARFVVASLCREDLSAQWRNTLILAAETVQIHDDQLRERLVRRLCDLATTLRHSTEAGINRIVHSAIRCYASMIPVSDADSLRTFLEPPNPVETRLVTLQCVVHLFEPRPPENSELLQRLADRIYELAEKFLDRDWLVAGERAAIGQNATFALAAIGDARFSCCIETIRQLKMKWLTRQIERKLDSLLRNWSVDPDVSKHPAIQLVQEQLAILRSQADHS